MHHVWKKEEEKTHFLKTPKNGFLGDQKSDFFFGTEQLSPVMMGGGPPFRKPSFLRDFLECFKFFKESSRAGRREKFFGISDAIRYCQRASLTANRLK